MNFKLDKFFEVSIKHNRDSIIEQKTIATNLECPNDRSVIAINEAIQISGWILPKENDFKINILAKTAKFEKYDNLFINRPDVVRHFLPNSSINSSITFCGFQFEVEFSEKIELFICIDGLNYLWKTIELVNVKISQIHKAESLAEKIYGKLPSRTLMPVDKENCLSDTDLFNTIIKDVQPNTIIELGSVTGNSAILMAKCLDNFNLFASRILCVDTWLGSLDDWLDENLREQLYLENGYPSLYKKFLGNVIDSNYNNYIIPFPMISFVASNFFKTHQIEADLIYIRREEEDSVKNDLRNFYPLLSQKGIIFGDKFSCQSIAEAVCDFAKNEGLGVISKGNKYILFRYDQLNKFIREDKVSNLVVEANFLKKMEINLQKEVYELLPMTRTETIIVDNEDWIFSEDFLGSIYLFDINFDIQESNNLIEESNIILSACFASSSIHKIFTSYTYNPASIYLVHLPEVLMFTPHSLLIFQFNKYWSDSLYLINWQSLPINRQYNKLILRNTNLSPRIIDQTTILLTSFNAVNNYYHWHIDVLPIAFSLKDKINSKKFIVISHQLNDWQKNSLELLGIDLSAIQQLGEEIILCKSVIYSSHLSGTAFEPPIIIRIMFECIKKSYFAKYNNIENESVDSPKLIFISREDKPERRSLLNESEAFNAIEQFGFIKVIPGYLSYEEQIKTFANAEIIVAPHGAGLTNMGFTPSSCTIIEILPESYVNICYWRLSQVLGNKYVYVIATVDEEQQCMDIIHHVKFNVIIDVLIDSLLYVLNAINLDLD